MQNKNYLGELLALFLIPISMVVLIFLMRYNYFGLPIFFLSYSLYLLICLTNIKLIFIGLLSVFLFKSLSISYSISFVESDLHFKILLGIDYIFLLIVFIRLSLLMGRIVYFNKVFCLAVLFLGFFLLFGMIKNGFMPSVIYFRYFSGSLILFTIGWYFKDNLSSKYVTSTLLCVATIIFIFTLIETLSAHYYYEIFNVDQFFTKKNGYIYSSVDEFAELGKRKFLNYFDFMYTFRPRGLTLQTVSTAYIVASIGLFLFYYKKYFFSLFTLFTVLLLGSKGAIFFFVASIVFFTLRLRLISVAILLIVYLGIIIYIGLSKYDPHVYSLISSFLHLPSSPLGQGFGFGGSITTGTDYGASFESLNGDSAVAVIINMSGFIGFVFYFYLVVNFSKYLNKLTKVTPRLKLYHYAFLVLVANSFIQEEVLNHFVMGVFLLVTLIAGVNRGEHDEKSFSYR